MNHVAHGPDFICTQCKKCVRGMSLIDECLPVHENGGIKLDQGKADLSMVSLELVELVARVRMFGAKKYSRGQWKKGFKVTRSLAAALRHIFLFLSGETNDSESGLSHLGHAVCCLEHAIFDMANHPENDDRGNQ